MNSQIPLSVIKLTEQRIAELEAQIEEIYREIFQLEQFLGVSRNKTSSITLEDSGLSIAQFCAHTLMRPFSRQDIRSILQALFSPEDVEKIANRTSVALTTEKKRVQERDFNWFTLDGTEYFAPITWFYGGFLRDEYCPRNYDEIPIAPGSTHISRT